MTTTIEYSQIANAGIKYVQNMVVTNDATTPNTVLDVSAGMCRDSSNEIDIVLGNYLGLTSTQTAANVSTTINAAVNGVNGLDTGSLAASTFYYVYAIADVTKHNQPACILSATVPSSPTVGPLMPTGYNVWKWIGCAVTNSSSHFLLAYTAGDQNARIFYYDAPQATSVTAGAQTSYTAVDLTKFVPNFAANTPVMINYAYTPGTAGDIFKMQPVNGTGDAVTITGQVTTVVMSDNVEVLAQQASNKPEINYKVSSGDTVAINVAGFKFYL